VEADTRSYLAVIGVISAPSNDGRRDWGRQYQATRPELLLRFVVGAKGVSSASCRRLVREHAEVPGQHDLHFALGARDNEEVGCVDKAFSWYMDATRLYPGASFVIKTDDDSATDMAALSALLSQHLALPKRPDLSLVYGGWAQFASFVPSTFQKCGWGVSPASAARRRQQCPSTGGTDGPYVFAAGALELFSHELARAVFGSAWARDFVASARDAARGKQLDPTHRWACYTEDVTVGYALHSQAARLGLPVTFVALNGRIIDVERFLSSRIMSAWTRGDDTYLTVHRWEPRESALLRMEHIEDENNVRERAENKTVVRHKHSHAKANRLVRDHLHATLRAAHREGGSGGSNLTMVCNNQTTAGTNEQFFTLPDVADWQNCWFVDESRSRRRREAVRSRERGRRQRGL